jgi:hypothetical protein
LFLFLLIATNLTLLPLYYQSEKQDYRRLATFLKLHLKEGDKIIDSDGRLLGLLYYLGVPIQGRFYHLDYWNFTEGETEYRKSFVYQNKVFTIYHSKTCCDQYLGDGSRLWIFSGIQSAEWLKRNTPSVLKGYFDGSFFHGIQFPTDASMYLFLWDPQSPDEKGIDFSLEQEKKTMGR